MDEIGATAIRLAQHAPLPFWKIELLVMRFVVLHVRLPRDWGELRALVEGEQRVRSD